MIEGLHEIYRSRQSRAAAPHYVSDLTVYRWRVQFSQGALIYERSQLTLAENKCGPYVEEWRIPISSVRSIQIETTPTFDKKLSEQVQYSHAGREFPAFYGVSKVEPFRAGDGKIIDEEKNYGEPIYRSPGFHSSDKNWSLVLYIFLLDGSRRLIAHRLDATPTRYERGYSDLLRQQTALMTGVQEARRRKMREREEAIERAQYL